MEIPDLSFQLDINYDGDMVDLMHYLKSDSPDLTIEWHNIRPFGKTANNYIEIKRNYVRNVAKIDEKDGWFNYPFTILVISRINLENITENDLRNQINFCHHLIGRLENIGCTVKAHTQFGDIS